jgi:hypothetical protein
VFWPQHSCEHATPSVREFRYCRTAQAMKASIAIPAMRNKLTTSASSSFNRRANSSLPHCLTLGANLDMAAPSGDLTLRALLVSVNRTKRKASGCCAEATDNEAKFNAVS